MENFWIYFCIFFILTLSRAENTARAPAFAGQSRDNRETITQDFSDFTQENNKKWRRDWAIFQSANSCLKPQFFLFSTSNLALCGTSSYSMRHGQKGENLGKSASNGEKMGKVLECQFDQHSAGHSP